MPAEPVAGQRVAIGSTVTLDISLGPLPVPVPTLVGKSEEDARNKLIVDGFVVGASRPVFNAVNDPGTVLNSDPPAGTQVSPGSTISLEVAASLVVPDVAGRPIAEAISTLTTDGFAPTEGDAQFSPDVDGGSVIRTDPPIGARVDPENPVVTVVASNAVTVPDLTRSTIGAARSTVQGLGLQLDVATWLTTDGSIVYAQQPVVGTRVPPGTTVAVGALG